MFGIASGFLLKIAKGYGLYIVLIVALAGGYAYFRLTEANMHATISQLKSNVSTLQGNNAQLTQDLAQEKAALQAQAASTAAVQKRLSAIQKADAATIAKNQKVIQKLSSSLVANSLIAKRNTHSTQFLKGANSTVDCLFSSMVAKPGLPCTSKVQNGQIGLHKPAPQK